MDFQLPVAGISGTATVWRRRHCNARVLRFDRGPLPPPAPAPESKAREMRAGPLNLCSTCRRIAGVPVRVDVLARGRVVRAPLVLDETTRVSSVRAR